MRPAPAVDAAPPVTPNAPRPPELADARRVQANFVETLVFRFLATPLALLLASLHVAGLATLTHSPAPMGFLKDVLERPDNERPFILIPVGYPAAGAEVPRLEKKSFEEIAELL